MALDTLLARLEGRLVTPFKADETADVTPKPAPMLACTPVTSVTAKNDNTASKAAGDALSDSAMEARRQRVLAILAERPSIRYAVSVDSPDRNPVILALGIRDQATCEIHVRRDKFDPFKLIDLIERHGSTLHK